MKDNGHLYFIHYLDTLDSNIDLYSRSQAAFVLAVICDGHPKVGLGGGGRGLGLGVWREGSGVGVWGGGGRGKAGGGLASVS